MSKSEKRQIIVRLLTPVFIIIAALLYKPVRNWLGLAPKPTSAPAVTDGKQLEVDYIDVGQGDSTLVSKGDFHMLIDAGKNTQGENVVKYLSKKGIKKLDILVGTHPDSDHIGGLDDVIKNIKVENVYLPNATKQTKTYSDVLKAMSEKTLKARMPEIKKEYKYDNNLIVRFISPGKNYKNSNDNSLVVQVAYGKNRFLFMGDAEEDAEKDIIASGIDVNCDVLKVGHHGSYTATSDAFLKKADPAYAVVSAGKGNSYGHPHASTISKLRDEDVQVYRTDEMGTICAKSDGKRVSFSSEKD